MKSPIVPIAILLAFLWAWEAMPQEQLLDQADLPDWRAEPPGDADLEIIATTTLRLTPEHTARYVEALLSAARNCFGSLKVVGPGEAPAPYRLVIEHEGTVSVGGLVGPKLVQGTIVRGYQPFDLFSVPSGPSGAQWVTYVPTNQSGLITPFVS